jgi:D-3-phosphoglycerate dehydrogenase
MSTPVPHAQIRVLLLENIHRSAVEMFAELGVHVETVTGALKEDELIARLEGVHILGIRSKTRVTEKVLAAAKDLIAVGAFCIGTNQIDLDAAQKRGVPVYNAPFSNTRSVAEMIIGWTVFLARQLGDRSREVHDGQWRKVATGCYELRGKTLGIVGYGHIGSQVGVLAEAMGMRVLSYDIRSTMAIGNARPLPSLDALLEAADFVTLHVPETPATKNMIGAPELARMKKGSYLMNASRGTVVDIPALAHAVKSGHLAGAAIDVFPEEPETNSDGFKTELRGLANVILTPHIGGSTMEAQEAIGREVATALSKYLDGGSTVGSVNYPPVELPRATRTTRVLNIHKNVPGVLRDVNRIVSDANANIRAQILATDADVGYLLMDFDESVSPTVADQIGALPTSIRTRIL